nr:ACT domain-containing protein [Corynebacterium lactis]
MFAIITVTGEDHTGIIAAVTAALAEQDVNIVDVSQTLMDKWFTMILRVEFDEKATPISELQDHMDSVGKREALVIRIQSEAIFNAVNEI